ncbi:MAG TPA: RagB/SusD family nutrient uptake outer membrane protein, partial [Gemmatimonadota bacterium]|nr:RagB/SusD family nutrient uptake outer membrane protein [Gemmatimonadota bacterium]
DSTASLDLGVYDSYGTGSGDQTNGLFQPSDDPNIRAHPSVAAEADSQSNGQLDERVLRKTRAITFRTFGNVGSDVGYRIYSSLTAPVPIIRNEELILLKAEANVGLGNLDAARNDINFIRTTSGKLDPVGAFASQQEALDQLLYEKRYSLLFEGGHRWIDLRRYGLLDRVAHGANESVINERYPIPLDEQNARK